MRVEVDGVRLFFDVEGAKLRPNGPWLEEVPTVVIVHTGPGSDHTGYKEHIGPHLAAVAQVVYVDLRGTGRSDRSTPDRWNVETWSSDLRGMMQRLGIERPVLLASGFGCFVALRFAQRWPGDLSKLVLSSPNARAIASRIVARYDELGGAVAGEAARAFLEQPDDQTLAAFFRDCMPLMLGRMETAGLMLLPQWNLDQTIHWTATEMRTLDLLPDVGDVTTETLVLAAGSDPQYPVVSIVEVVDALPNARVAWYPEARHSIFRDAPESLDLVKEFVA